VKRWTSILIALACLTALVTGSMPASAGHQDPYDGDDVRGRLDIRRVQMWGPHVNSGFRITTFRRWSTRFIWDSGFFVVNVDSFGQPRFDYYVLVRSNGSRMEGLLFRDRETRRDRLIRKVRVWRPTDKSISFRFPWNDIRFPEKRRFFRWNAQSLFTNDYCPNVCIDNVPNKGAVTTTVRPAPTPTATTESSAP
jgi:hypothetical protein